MAGNTVCSVGKGVASKIVLPGRENQLVFQNAAPAHKRRTVNLSANRTMAMAKLFQFAAHLVLDGGTLASTRNHDEILLLTTRTMLNIVNYSVQAYRRGFVVIKGISMIRK